MDLFDVAKSCIRRWYVVLSIILLAGLASIPLIVLARPTYYNSTVVGITLPAAQIQTAQPGIAVPRNGLVDAGGSVLIASIIAASLTESSVKDKVLAAGGENNYTVKMFPVPAYREQIPLVTVEATEPDPDSAAKTVELVASQAAPVTRQLQQRAGVPEDQMVKSLVVSHAGPPRKVTRGQLRATVEILLIGAAAAVSAAVAVDVLLMRRNARKDPGQPASSRAWDGADVEGGSTAGEAEKARSQNAHVASEATVAGQ